MKLIKIWHFQFGDFEIEKPETCQIVTKVYSIGQRIKSGHCCLCSAHGSWLTALDASDRLFLLPVSCEGQGDCHVIIQPGDYPAIVTSLSRIVTMVSSRGGHLVILSQDVCLAPGGRLLSRARKCHVTCYTHTWHVTLTPSAPQCHLFSSLELLISDPQEIIIRRPDRDHH